MKPGLVLGVMVIVTGILVPRAQNLGLGTGSRSAVEDSTALESINDSEDSPSPRKSLINRRLGLSGRKNIIDPKFFEARGRDLTNQFYEITTPADPKKIARVPPPVKTKVAAQKTGSRQWVYWVGAAGITGASAGAIGFLLMQKSHPGEPTPIPLDLTDAP